ncbi:MAG: A/G-specific adenine glycosylase [Patescibacteria group bacterium]
MPCSLQLRKTRVHEVQSLILEWFLGHHRDLPWRKTTDPYAILVSEIMLQQTQVSRIIPKFEAFLVEFPSAQTLADSSPAAVITAWKGLGYNRRALNLQRAASIMTNEHGGTLPPDLVAIRALPGVGRYTAGAIMNFAFNIDTPAVDVNVERFIDHFFPARAKRSANDYYAIAEKLMPAGQARVWLHAVMDYTSANLRARAKNTTKPTEPFVGSNRYFRGRMLDILRERTTSPDALFTAIGAPLDLPRKRFDALLEALEREGFIHRSGSELALRS